MHIGTFRPNLVPLPTIIEDAKMPVFNILMFDISFCIGNKVFDWQFHNPKMHYLNKFYTQKGKNIAN